MYKFEGGRWLRRMSLLFNLRRKCLKCRHVDEQVENNLSGEWYEQMKS